MLLLAGLSPGLGAGEVADGLDDGALDGVELAGDLPASGVRYGPDDEGSRSEETYEGWSVLAW